jgi:hypothetical protein
LWRWLTGAILGAVDAELVKHWEYVHLTRRMAVAAAVVETLEGDRHAGLRL